jgi:hypothetical protein
MGVIWNFQIVSEGLRVLYLELLLGVTGLLEPKVSKE